MNADSTTISSSMLPLEISLPGKQNFFSGAEPKFSFNSGLTVLVGPNGTGKTETLRNLRDYFRRNRITFGGDKQIVYLAAGRSSAFEQYRSLSSTPYMPSGPAAVGSRDYLQQWSNFEGSPGMFLRLKERPDLLLKVEARLQTLFQRRLRLDWTQNGLQVAFAPTTGGEQYYANVEASGLLQLLPLIAALYDNEISVLIIDEPEISLHPQLQAFLLQTMQSVAGDPADPAKKIVVIATHSPSMLPLRRIADISNLIFFTDRQTIPVQISPTAGELQNRKLAALITRLSENHKLAFFAKSVLLVEGPSDEIVIAGLSDMLNHPLLGGNTQVVPVTGKGQIPEAVKLFRMMGKQTFVMADLDALADDNRLISLFKEAADPLANAAGVSSITDIDRDIRHTLATNLDLAFTALQASATQHRYWTERGPSAEDELRAKRRATLAALLTTLVSADDQSFTLKNFKALRSRYDALLDILSRVGCIFLRRGTIEDYYLGNYPTTSFAKPEAAAAEIELLANHTIEQVRTNYADVIRAVQTAAPIRTIDENELLREQLGSLLGAALQIVKPGMSDEELNARAGTNISSAKPVFSFSNRTTEEGSMLVRRVQVAIRSPLFLRDEFPFEVSEKDNLVSTIGEKLPHPR